MMKQNTNKNINSEFAQKEQRPLRRFFSLGALLCVGILLSVVLFVTLRHWEWERLESSFHHDASDSVSAIEREIQSNFLILDSLQTFYIGSHEVERAEFKQFVRP